jgi:hypothetical protein
VLYDNYIEVCEMNDRAVTEDRKEALGKLCCRVSTLPGKHYFMVYLQICIKNSRTTTKLFF